MVPSFAPDALVGNATPASTDYRGVLAELLVARGGVGSAGVVFPGLHPAPVGVFVAGVAVRLAEVGRVTDWASRNGLSVDRVVTEVGSGLNGKRPKFARLLADPLDLVGELCGSPQRPRPLRPWGLTCGGVVEGVSVRLVWGGGWGGQVGVGA